jgi:S-adenosylmethionine synthetase
MSRQYLFTSESVSEGHPDKIADQISDAIVDAFLDRDPNARVACETLVASDHVTIAGEFKSSQPVFDFLRGQAEQIVRQILRDIGYTDAASGIDPERCTVDVRFNRQSPHIAQGVDRDDGQIGAGDQGLMFGYACDETVDLLPYPLWLAHRLVERQAELRKSDKLPWLRPDAKSQVTIRYGADGSAEAVTAVVLSTQHAISVSHAELVREVQAQIIDHVVPQDMRSPDFRALINPTGRFEIGGPNGDTGLTGRKIIVDTYGGSCPHGGGAFSGKDPTKVDRSAAYMARYIAKNIVAAGLARRCTVQLAYAIGVAEPVSLMIQTAGTASVSEAALEERIRETFDLTPKGIIDTLDLRRPIYRKTATYGHFGRPGLPWEQTDQADELRRMFEVEPGSVRTVL